MFLGQVTIKGNQALSSRQITNAMENQMPALFSLAGPPRFDRTSVERDQNSIWQLYRENGYFNASVTVTATTREGENQVDLLVEVTEGELFYFTGVELIFANPEDEIWRERLTNVVAIKAGQAATVDLYSDSKELIRQFLANHGHPLSNLQGQLVAYSDTMEARARFLLDAGPPVTFGKVQLTGTGYEDHDFITRRVTFFENQPFSESALEMTRQNIFASDLFTSVTITPLFEQMENNQVPIAIDWQNAPPHALSLGLGWGTEDQFRTQIYQINRNLFNLNDTLTFEGKYSSIYTGITGRWHVPFNLMSFELAGGVRQTDNEAYNDKSFFINPSLTFQLRENWSITAGFNCQLFSMRELKADVPDPDYYNSDTMVNSIPISLTYDSRDSILDPTRGTTVSLGVEIASKGLGSDVGFVQPGANVSQVIPLEWDNWFVAWRVRAALTFLTENDDRLPLYSRFFPGGSMSVRGYRFQNLGPLDDNSRPLGGEAVVEGSVELRFPLIGDLGGVLFVDVGNAYERYYDLSDGLRYACGAGLRYHTPLGPIRLDFGYALNPPEKYTYPDYQIFLSVGQAF